MRLQDNHGNNKIINEVERKGQHQMPEKMNKELRVYTYPKVVLTPLMRIVIFHTDYVVIEYYEEMQKNTMVSYQIGKKIILLCLYIIMN